jgi:hypothetical protein
MHGVAVAWPAEIRQPSGDRQSSAIVGRESKTVADVEHRDREAAVQVEERDLIDLDLRGRECRSACHARCF